MRSVLHASGASARARCAIGDPHIPASKLEPVMHEARAVHRLDDGDHFCIAQSMRKLRQTVEIRRAAPASTRTPSIRQACQARRLRLRSSPVYTHI
jgi:hypothetical protein